MEHDNFPQWLTQDGALTPDASNLVAFMEYQFEGIKQGDVVALNKISGPIKYYMTNYVYMLAENKKAKLPVARVKFFQDAGQSIARNAWGIYQFSLKEHEKAQQIEENTDATNEIAEGLQALKEELAKMAKANAKLTKKVKALETVAAKDVADAEDDEEPEADATDDEQPEAEEK